MDLSALTALTPLDGRYADKSEPLREVFSEYGLIKRRVLVEIKWLLCLAAHPGVGEVGTLSGAARSKLAAIAEHNCLKMHSIMWASRPPMVYWNAATMRCLQTVRQLQGQGVGVFFTIDAGPQVKAVCLPEQVVNVAAALRATPGVVDLMTTGLGEGARLESTG